jgi:hypothetical protein
MAERNAGEYVTFSDAESDKAAALKEQADKHAEELARLRAMNDKMVGVLKELDEATNAWVHQYASEFCDADSVVKYKDLIQRNNGTLAYTARLGESIRTILAEYEAMKGVQP